MKLRLGIIGAGNIASAHIQNVLDGKCPNIEIVAVADRKESRRQWAAEKLPDARIFTEGSDLIAAKCYIVNSSYTIPRTIMVTMIRS